MVSPRPVLRLGTRRSLLAWAQSAQVARQLEKIHPGVQVELVGIETRGDRIQDVSLMKVEGKEFFVAELDDALREGRVDLSVHSLKDLSLDRPVELVCGAIPPRQDPRDIVLLGPLAESRLREGIALRIGTSSPRRQALLPAFLERALPSLDPARRAPRVELHDIRGNVNTRLGRLHLAADHPHYMDGVALALAGMNRLAQDEAGSAALRRLLQCTRWIVPPLMECPAAPAQGALAVECRADDWHVRELLRPLHDAVSAQAVARERAVLAEWGGGCHQRLGASVVGVVQNQRRHEFLRIRGIRATGEAADDLRWEAPPRPTPAARGAWISQAPIHHTLETLATEDWSAGEVYFVAHERAGSPLLEARLRPYAVLTPGVQTWFQLARRGIWVGACAEGLGFSAMQELARAEVLGLGSPQHWHALTHTAATLEWEAQGIRATAVYRRDLPGELMSPPHFLSQITHVFWRSGGHWAQYHALLSPDVHHACGFGKTAYRLTQENVKPLNLFPSLEEWRKWIHPTKPFVDSD